MNDTIKNGNYRVNKVGGFEIGTYNSKSTAKKAILKNSDKGFYQIIDSHTGYAIWEGYN